MQAFAKRYRLHTEAAEAADHAGDDHNVETAVLFRIVEAIHEVGATICMALTVQQDDSADMAELGEALTALLKVTQEHTDVLEKIRAGRGVYGELIEVNQKMAKAIERIQIR